ncbi:magnesium transporter [bacterium]|nr:magnesium transporter [bacterium]
MSDLLIEQEETYPQERPDIAKLHREVEEFLEEEQFEDARKFLEELHPAEIADLMNGFDSLERNMVFDLVDEEVRADVLSELEEIDQEGLLDRMTDSEIGDIIGKLHSDDATDIAALLDEQTRHKVLLATPIEDREEVMQLLGYDEESAGGLMSLEMVTVPVTAKVSDAIKAIRFAVEKTGIDNLNQVYVVEKDLQLVGSVSLLELILANPKDSIVDVTNKDIITISTEMDQEKVARRFQRYDLFSAPVVDEDYKLVGRITVDDIVDVMQEEAEEDLGYLGGTGEEEVGERNIFRASRARLPWLLVAFFGELISVFILAKYEVDLRNLIIIAFFIPVVIAVAGNVGIQSSTIVVRGLATGEIPMHHTFRRVRREVMVGSLNGTIISITLGVIIWFWRHEFLVATAVGVSMIAVVVIAAIVGSIIPFILKSTKQDPAHASGPFITMANDIIGLTVYMIITTSILS